MSQVLKSLAENLKWEDELIAQTKKLIMYPAFVGSIVLAVTMFLMIYLVPQMIGFIKGTGQPIPLQTRLLIHVSDFLIGYWWAVLATPVIAVIGINARPQAQPRVPLPLRRLQAAPAAARADPAQDHPVALRQRLRHDVFGRHHHSRQHQDLGGNRRQPGDQGRAWSAPGSRSPKARTCPPRSRTSACFRRW